MKTFKPGSVHDLLLNVSDNLGDVWGLVVFGHGDKSGKFILTSNAARANIPPYGEIVTQDNLIARIRAGRYKIARVYMMQCHSAAGGYDQLWKNATMNFYGYKGLNVLGGDMGSKLLPWNWFDGEVSSGMQKKGAQ